MCGSRSICQCEAGNRDSSAIPYAADPSCSAPVAATQVAPGVPEIEAAKRWLTASGYFGASTGAGAAIAAAADSAVNIDAVVSRGGRPDLAGESLKRIDSPTLLIVGGLDDVVLELNRQVQVEIPAECELVVVPGATHLFEEPGTLEKVAVLARDWFTDHFRAARSRNSAVDHL